MWQSAQATLQSARVDTLVSLVGAGPGDPSLLTLAAVRALARADAVLYDPCVHPAVLAHARSDATLIRVDHTSEDQTHGQKPEKKVTTLLLNLAREGKRVCRLHEGDPFLFGTGAEEAEVLAQHGIPFEVVPGVSPALGATAYAGIPLTHPALSCSVTFVDRSQQTTEHSGLHEHKTLATTAQTIVIFTDIQNIREEMERLVAVGQSPDTPAAVIQCGSRADQRVITGTVADVVQRCEENSFCAPVLVVVGHVVRLRDTLRWWDRAPLFGRRILVTRAKEQAGPLIEALTERGAEAVLFPAIRFEPPTDPTGVDRAVQELQRYDAVVLTSANGVERLFTAIHKAGRDARALANALVVAIGPATAAALEAHGIRADAIPTEFKGEAAADATLALLAQRHGSPTGRRVLLARAEVARDALPQRLQQHAVHVDVVPVYRTVPAEDRDVQALRAALSTGQIDAVLFTSSSTVESVCDALGPDATDLLAPVVIASIGPITSDTVRRRGLHVTVEAKPYTIPGLVRALESHYARRNTP